MISGLGSQTNLFLDGLTRLQSEISKATEQLTSGYRINRPSDAPDEISPLLQLQAVLSHNQTISDSLASVQAGVTTADQAVSNAIQLLQQAGSLGAQGASGTTSAQTRLHLSQQVQTIQEQMVSLANTNASGRYIFSGDADGSPPYALNLNQPPTVPQNGVDRLVAQTATRQIELSDRSFTNVDQTAQDLFDHRNTDDSLAPDNVFAALNSLRVALAANNDAQITAAQTSVDAAFNYLNSKQTFYGNTLDRLTAALNQIDSENVNLQQQISGIRDTDPVQAALDLSSASTQQAAALAAEAKRPMTTLFDYLG